MSTPTLPLTPPGASNFGFLDAADKDGTTNSESRSMAATRTPATTRLPDHRHLQAHETKVRSDVRCRSIQGDVSVFLADDGRRILLQSIDRPVTSPGCNAVDTPVVSDLEGPDGEHTTDPANAQTRTRARFGYEGLRMFDVTNPRKPRFLRFFRTACGSHTHTLARILRTGWCTPMSRRIRWYRHHAAGRPGAVRCARADVQGSAPEDLDRPHPAERPGSGNRRREAAELRQRAHDPDGQPRSDGGTQQGNAPAFIACHDHQAFLPRDIMIGSCAGDAQYWSIKNRGNPTSADGEPHTHIEREMGRPSR